MRKFYVLILLFLAFTWQSYAQLSYQVSNYQVTEYGAGNQNWDVSGDGDQRIFVANNNGLLLLENTNVELVEFSEQTVFRSVKYINGTIYTGSFEDFGYWDEDENGELSYHSLATELPESQLNNDEIWSIAEKNGIIYFQSFGSIYGYDGEEVFRLEKNGSYMFLHTIGDEIYTQRVRGHLYTISGNTVTEIPDSDILIDEEVKSIIPINENTMLIGTTEGLYTYDGNRFKTWDAERSTEVIDNNINTILRTNDKIIIGTILNGLYVYDLNFRLLKNINTESQLQNNTVLSLHTDPYNNVWVGLDKGLSYVAFDSPVHSFSDEYSDIGSVYAAALFNNELYIGTNQGIYWYKRDSEGNFYDRRLIAGSQGQVWFIKEFDGKLYTGLNDGTYVLENKRLRKVSPIYGGYNLKKYTSNNRNVLLQSTYSDLVIYSKENEEWTQNGTLSGFSTPARFMEFDHLGNIWLGHTVKGVFQLQPNMQFDEIESVNTISEEEGLPANSNRIFNLDNRILSSYQDTLYQWDTINGKFVPYNELKPYFTESGTITNINPAGDQKYWIIKKNEINLLEVHFNTIRLLFRVLPKMYNFSLVEDYENVIPLNENLHLICLDEGFALLNLELANQSKYPTPVINLQKIDVVNRNQSAQSISGTDLNDNKFANTDNTLNFFWTTTQVAGTQAYFQYKLQGIDENWSEWTTQTSKRYERLPAGEYSFQVRSVSMNGLLTETMNYAFTIKKPWYLSTGAYLVYVLFVASFIFMIRLYISRKEWKVLSEELERKHKKTQLDREKAEKEIIKLRNEKLQNEVEHKSAQLATNTMAIMKKNNLLSSIKEELDKQKKELGKKLPSQYYKNVNKLIESGIEDEHEWEVFEQLYDQAHGDFFKRLKDEYPQLTPSDLRLCAYLRMNLSSKEIAPLLNISVRGVEERRYRLRKRLNLSTNTNLNELIMTF